MGVSTSENPSAVSSIFPLTVACVDAGSNAIRFAAATFLTEGRYELLDFQRVSIRLGHEVFLTGRLSSSCMDQAIESFKSFRRRIDELGVKRWRLCATSAVREASNSAEFIARIKEETGFDLEVISGAEEARLAHLAVAHKVDLGENWWMLVDLGGGSVEISLADRQGIHWFESYGLGSVRLLEQLEQVGHDREKFVRLLEEYVQAIQIPLSPENHLSGYIATGGNIEELFRLSELPLEADGTGRLPMAELDRVIKMLSETTYQQRIDGLGLRADRADVILPAAMVYEQLGILTGMTEILVPRVGVRDGILLDLAHPYSTTGDERQRDSQAEEAAISLGRKYRFDEKHGRQVANIAVSIFDQLTELHSLDRSARRLLYAGAILHDVGMFINRSGHHKHSLYLIESSNLFGFQANELRMIGNIARYHRKSPPKPSHASFQSLSKTDRATVVVLSAILRVADSLDRDHQQRVRGVQVVVERSRVRFLVDADGDLLLEEWSLRHRADMFRDVFDRRPVLEMAESAAPVAP